MIPCDLTRKWKQYSQSLSLCILSSFLNPTLSPFTSSNTYCTITHLLNKVQAWICGTYTSSILAGAMGVTDYTRVLVEPDKALENVYFLLRVRMLSGDSS